ncbi:MAG: hypothetical protein WDW36_003005 [Sanguina aurantia]
MEPSQVHLIKQAKVACLTNNSAHLALDASDPYTLQTKPHGHGDVHALLHSSGLAARWQQAGLRWVCFFQDTNALVFKGLVAALGVSQANDYDVNSLAIPRKAKEAIGAIVLLTHSPADADPGSEAGSASSPAAAAAAPSSPPATLTVNVEYNQLDPLLRSTTSPEGDVNDATGYSPFPGNINQLVLKLETYVPQLQATGGVISEFVNPKYKDASRDTFKSPTRLECMMQDYPKALPADANVGFTVINQVWASYSPVKNSPDDALAKFKDGNPTHSATTGELDIYEMSCKSLQQHAGIALPELGQGTFNGLTLPMYPRVVLSPSFATVAADITAKIAPASITLSPDAVLILDGEGITIQGPVRVEGALVVRAVAGARVTIGKLIVQNEGWSWQPLVAGEPASEIEKMRGFRVVKHATEELVFSVPGDYQVP